MSTIFRAIFIKGLKNLVSLGTIQLSNSLREKLYNKRWVVYAKRPFARPQHVIEYLGRYTHKVGISNYRLLNVDSTHVTFKWKDYRNSSTQKSMTLPISEFIRRLALHILAHRFVRIRHYGILSNHGRSKVIPHLQQLQDFQPTIDNIVTRPATILLQCSRCNSQNIASTILLKVRSRRNRAP